MNAADDAKLKYFSSIGLLGPLEDAEQDYWDGVRSGKFALTPAATAALQAVISGSAFLLTEKGVLTLSMSWSSGVPFVMVASGNITNVSGAITTGTAHDYVIGPSYTFFPASALFAGSPAGWYYTNWTSASGGTVYANTYVNGNPSIPAIPTPLTTVVGAYTQTTGADVLAQNVVIPGGAMGPNGMLEWRRVINNNNSAGVKTYNTYLGGTVFQGVTQTTNPREGGAGSLINRGRATAQAAANAAHGDSGNAGSVNKPTIDTTANQVAAMSIQVATATDYAMIEAFSFRVTYAG